MPWLPTALAGLAMAAQGGPATTPDAASSPTVAVTAAQDTPTVPARQTIQIDPDLIVTSEVVNFDPATGIGTFSRGVVAQYGPTTVRAERLVIDRNNRTAEAAGNVRLEDPDATLTADNLKFSWDPTNRTGEADNIQALIANVSISARRAELTPELWTFYDVAGSSCRNDPPLYQIRSRKLTIRPGQTGRAERPTLYLFGRKIVTVPDRSFNLNPRTEGFNIPSFSYRRGQGLGVAWNSGFLLDPRTNLNAIAGAFPGSKPGLGLNVTRTLLPTERITTFLTPESEFGERFRAGYLDNVEILRPDQEYRFYRTPQKSISLGSNFNSGVTDRGGDVTFSKPLEAIYEQGGEQRGFGYTGQARLQTISRASEATLARAVFRGTLSLPTFQIAPRVQSLVRLDAQAFIGGRQFGWTRALIGATYQPVPQVTLAAGAFLGQEVGTAEYDIDRLVAKSGFALRGDLNLGPTKVSYLTKWDRQLGFFDREYRISQVVGCLEPFILYRQRPSTYNIGVRFRLDEFYDLLRRREFRRSQPTTRTVISGPTPPGNATPPK